MFRELQPGLNISRCSEADFLHFVRLATYCTRYVRLREASRIAIFVCRCCSCAGWIARCVCLATYCTRYVRLREASCAMYLVPVHALARGQAAVLEVVVCC